MSLYFFDIEDGEALPDRQGLDLPDLSAAQAHAREIAITYLNQKPELFWHDHAWHLDVRKEGGSSLFRLSFTLAIA